jgi:signal transduction histidine kinase
LRLTFRSKLLLSHVALVASVVALVSFVLERSLAADLELQRDERLVEQARGSTEWVSSGRHPERVAARLASIVQAEVAIFDKSGCIVGSSTKEEDELDGDGRCLPPAVVEEARSTGLGRAARLRAEDRLHDVAVLADDGLVLRLTVSSREIEGPLAAMRKRLAFAALIAATAALVLGLFASRLASRPLRSMADQARRIAQGDYDVRFPPLPRDEFGHLADTLAALAKQLEADMQRISKLEITRRDFVANVTHELRTPVAAMQGLAETLQRGDVAPDKARRFAELMHKHAVRLSALIDGLLRLAELEGGSDEPISKTDVPVLEVAREVEETLRGRAAEAEVAVVIDVDAAAVAWADPGRLEQILVNLVDNAIKYGKRGGTVTIVARQNNDGTVLHVRDDGEGIAAEHLPRLFERFYRVDAGRSRERGGAGLGLAIVKHLAESMGGSVRVESVLGGGTTFTVELPAPRTSPVK